MRRLILVTALWSTPVLAQDDKPFDLSATMRLRYEAIGGSARAGVPASETLVNLRTIVRSRYHTGPLTFQLDVWDSRVLSPARPSAVSTNEVNALEPMQVSARYDFGAPAAALHGGLTVGRLATEIGSARLIANDDYRNTANGFTGARLDLAGRSGLHATLLYLLPQQRLPEDVEGVRTGRPEIDRAGLDTQLWGGNAGLPVFGRVALDVTGLRLDERDRPGRATRDRQLTTFGGRLFAPSAPGNWDIDIEGFRQTGRTSASAAPGAATLDVSAWFLHAEAGYRLAHGWQPHLSAEFDYASGDDRAGRYGRFDTLYGHRRRDFSPAGLLSAIGRSNIVAAGARAEFFPGKRIEAFGSVRKLWLASRFDGFATTGVIDASGASGRDAGWEFDSRIRYWLLPKRLQLEIDGIVIAKGRFLKQAPNRTNDSNTRYLSINLTTFL